MLREELESHGKGFSKFYSAQQKTKEVVAEVARQVKPGMKESEVYHLILKTLRAKGSLESFGIQCMYVLLRILS